MGSPDATAGVVDIDTGDGKASGTLDVLVERTDGGGWAFTPLTASVPLEVREVAADGLPPAGARGVIWRLDDGVFAPVCGPGLQACTSDKGEDAAAAVACLAQTVPARLERASSDVEQLESLAAKLQDTLSNFHEERQRLEERRAEVDQQHADLQERSAQLEEDRERFNSQVSDAAEHLARALRAPVRAGEVAVQPADVFFVAAQDEFARAAPPLSVDDEAELQHVRLTPEAAFVAAKEAFFSVGRSQGDLVGGGEAVGAAMPLRPRVDALVRALLSLHCLDEQQAPMRHAQALERLLSIAQALTRVANNTGHLPLAFAASSCASWCALRLEEHLANRWDEVQPEDLLREPPDTMTAGQVTSSEAEGQLLRRARLLAQFGKVARRLLRSLSEHPDHRRRFLRFMANRGLDSASEADLRLLLLARDAGPAELAAHVRRLSGLADEHVVLVPSRRKRPRQAEAEGGGNGGP